MRAFVLGGGSNLGPMQVGALQALFENKIYPDALVGCSVGGVNAAFLAQRGYKECLPNLAMLWDKIRRQDIYSSSKIESLARLVMGYEGLTSNRGYRTWLHDHGLHGDFRFEQMAIPLYITATNYRTGCLHTFGHRKDDSVLDSVMASSAVPPLHAPWQIDGERYIDGSIVTPLPLRVALELGATEIYAIRVEHFEGANNGEGRGDDSVRVVQHSINTMIKAQAEHDLHLAETAKNTKLTYIKLAGPKTLDRLDFGHGKKLVERGYRLTAAQLNKQPVALDERHYTSLTAWQSFSTEVSLFQSKLQQIFMNRIQTV